MQKILKILGKKLIYIHTPIHTCFPMIASNLSEVSFASLGIYYVEGALTSR